MEKRVVGPFWLHKSMPKPLTRNGYFATNAQSGTWSNENKTYFPTVAIKHKNR
jgi:hypothetical protein